MSDKATDIIIRLNALKKAYEPIKSIRKAAKEVGRSFDAYERAARTGLITGDDEATIMADAIARKFADLLCDVSTWDENKWVEQSGYNLLNHASRVSAVASLKVDRERFVAVRDALRELV